MKMVKFPIGLPVTGLTPLGGPRTIGQSQSETAFAQNVVDPFGLWSFKLDFGPLQRGAARAFKRLTTSAHAGANCFRLNFFDPDEPTYEEMGTHAPAVRWSNNQTWAHGQGWKPATPKAVAAAESPAGSAQITLNIKNWRGILPAYFGIVGHFAVYSIVDTDVNGDIATLTVWPPVRHKIETGALATFRPVLAARLIDDQGASWQNTGKSTTGASLSVIEVLDETVRAL